MIMIQRGRNTKYPGQIETWRKGEEVPEWLTDVAKVEMMDLGSGKKMIKTNDLSSGGIEIIAADGKSTLVRTTGESDYVCYGDNKLFSLTETQMELLYKCGDKK